MFFFIKSKKKKLALTSFYYVSREIWLGNSKKLICIDQSRFSHTHENSKIFNITSKYFSFFNNKPPANWVTHITRDFLTCYSCLHYSSMVIPCLFEILWCLFDLKKDIIYLFDIICLFDFLHSFSFTVLKVI